MADITITDDELKDPGIDDMINLQRSLQPQSDEPIVEIKTPLYFNPVFYYAVAGSVGALAVWAAFEPYFNDDTDQIAIPFVSDYILFGPVAGVLGLAIGVMYGIANRNARQAAYCGAVGLGVGLGVTVLTTVVADIVFGITTTVATSSMQVPPGGFKPDEFPIKGVAFFIFMCGRGLAWAIISMGAGLGLGIALKSKQLTLNGFVGGLIGGLLGGLFFDPISRWIDFSTGDASMSRCVGVLAVGLFVGLFIGIFENISKEAWFQMLKGPLAGKHFVLFKQSMRIGSAPKSDIYLFKDPDVAPLHASVKRTGRRYMIEDEHSEKGVFVNGKKVEKYLLQPGDTVSIGETVLRYHEKGQGA